MNSCFAAKKAVQERLDWVFDFDRWLPDGDSIASVEAEPSSGFLWETLPVIEGDRIRLWVSGGLPQGNYSVTVVVTTTQGRRKTECLNIRITTNAVESVWPDPEYANDWADRIFIDCSLGFKE